ncbi:hypothetical protein B0H10DRAFT_2235293 [Mycena sp. CBHHK59/15]|nr:hypothetical protein B0H10DRAFT_2235293 [Mycena sp. CBHHK59/15]
MCETEHISTGYRLPAPHPNVLVSDPAHRPSRPQRYGAFGTQSSQTGALDVVFIYAPCSTPPSQLNPQINNNPHPNYPYLASYAALDDTLATPAVNWIELVGTTQSPPDWTPFAGQSAFGSNHVESVIWSYDTTTHELSPTWVNPDKTTFPLSIVLFSATLTMTPTDKWGTCTNEIPIFWVFP